MTEPLLRKATEDEILRERQTARELWEHDWATLKVIAQREGREEGLAEGIEEGLAKGIEEGRAKGIEQGRAKGIEEGLAKGIEEGRAKGIEQGRAEARRILREEAIDTLIETLLELDLPREIIETKLRDKLKLSEEEAQKILDKKLV